MKRTQVRAMESRDSVGLPWRAALLDPPWLERGGGKIKRGADRHYKLLKTVEMPGVIRSSGLWVPATHAHCYLWVTNNFLEDGLWLLRELGVRYVSNVVWTKDRAGLGQYFRGKHELLLFGTIGKGKDPSVYQDNRSITSVIHGSSKARIHSRKPESVFELVESRSKGPCVEFFGAPELPTRPGWVRWGDSRYQPQS